YAGRDPPTVVGHDTSGLVEGDSGHGNAPIADRTQHERGGQVFEFAGGARDDTTVFVGQCGALHPHTGDAPVAVQFVRNGQVAEHDPTVSGPHGLLRVLAGEAYPHRGVGVGFVRVAGRGVEIGFVDDHVDTLQVAEREK